MIDIDSCATPIGHKVHIMLEECDLPNRVIPANMGSEPQFESKFLQTSPNNKMTTSPDSSPPESQTAH